MTSPYLGCMLAHEVDYDRVVYPVAVEEKLDGLRVTHVDGEGYTRNGRAYETWRAFSKIFAGIVPAGCHVDTEMCARNWNETSSLLKRLKKIDHDAIRENVTAHVFDAFDVHNVESEPFESRRASIEWVVERAATAGYKIITTPLTIVHSRAELDAAFKDARARGVEGIMIKRLDGVYRLKKCWEWMKVKAWRDVTVIITGLNHGWGQCPACMTIEMRRKRAVVESLGEESDVKPDPTCLVCLGATKGLPRWDFLGSFSCVDSNGNAWDVGMGFTDAEKFDFMKRGKDMIGKKIDVRVQDDGPLPETPTGPVPQARNDIVARHAVFLRERGDV